MRYKRKKRTLDRRMMPLVGLSELSFISIDLLADDVESFVRVSVHFAKSVVGLVIFRQLGETRE